MSEKIGIDRLKSVSVIFDGDFYDLALFLLKMNDAKDKGTTGKSRYTVHGVATVYSMIADVRRDKITRLVERGGLPLGATVEHDDDVQ